MEFPKEETLTDMMLAELDKLGKTQLNLASELEIDSSTLSRRLNNNSDTSYRQIREMQDIIQEWKAEQQQPATELMTKGFTSTTLNETRSEAADKMVKNDFSQLPVRENKDGEIIGLITDVDLMTVHDDDRLISKIKSNDGLRHVIEVATDADRRLIEKILDEGHPAVLVVDNGTPEGIITRADLLETASPAA